jgi:hypothetical protein
MTDRLIGRFFFQMFKLKDNYPMRNGAQSFATTLCNLEFLMLTPNVSFDAKY